jgi:large repetitive protein
VDKTGNAGASAQVSATPVAASDSEDTTPPAEVSGLSAVAGDGQVVLSWTEPTDADFLAVLINYLGIETYVTVAKGIDTYTFTGLTNGQHYTFNVISVDASGNAGAAAQASATPVATTIPSDSTPPAEVTGLSAVAGESQVSLSWTAPADSDFASVSISYTGLAAPITVAKGSSTYTFTGLTDGTAYDFTVKTVDTTGNSSTGVAASATPVDLTPPANVTAVSTVAFNGSVTLSWTEPSDADYAGVQISYAGLATPISVAKSTVRYTVTGLTNSTEYTFTVKAVDSAGNPASGVAVKATPDASKIGIVLQ